MGQFSGKRNEMRISEELVCEITKNSPRYH